MSHSPGPWRYVRDRSLSDYDDYGSKWGAASIEADAGCVQQIAHVTHDSLYPDETNANIRLIEAAPELLAACKVLALTDWTVAFLETTDPMALRQLRDAIAKATGTSLRLPPASSPAESLPMLPVDLVCDCGHEDWVYVEDISCARQVNGVDEHGTLQIDGLYTTNGYDEAASNPRIQCRHCCTEYAVPDHEFF